MAKKKKTTTPKMPLCFGIPGEIMPRGFVCRACNFRGDCALSARAYLLEGDFDFSNQAIQTTWRKLRPVEIELLVNS